MHASRITRTRGFNEFELSLYQKIKQRERPLLAAMAEIAPPSHSGGLD